MNRRYVFLLNPAAGQGKAIELKEKIRTLPKEIQKDIEIYETKEILHGEIVASKIAKRATAENPIRIYACGGDGTLNEVLNGIIEYKNVELAVIPMGTGNDFIRNFGSEELFLDLEKQIGGRVEEIDIIKYRLYKDDFEYEKYCINMINIGFDANVVDAAKRLKRKPFISGTIAYVAGILETLVKKRGADVKITFEDNRIFKGELLLAAIANGCYCGGGIKGVPLAETTDGYMDVSLIKQCNRRKIMKLLPKYQKGTHLNSKDGKKLVTYTKEKMLTIEANKGDMMFSTDGELTYAKRIELEILPKAVKFVIPESQSMIEI